MTDDEQRHTAQILLKEIQSCIETFDPTFEHPLGAESVPKIILLPIPLKEKLYDLLSSL